MTLAVKYAIFAMVATAANIAAQDFSLGIYGAGTHGDRGAVVVSVLVGTAVGLLVKYYLDKTYIFRFTALDVAHDTRTFALYSLMGIVTTAVFWGFEFGFDWMFQNKQMRYLGGVIGLSIGYLLKYQLDKRFVFRPQGS